MLTSNDIMRLTIYGSLIGNETKVKLEGMAVDNKFSFETHLNVVNGISG